MIINIAIIKIPFTNFGKEKKKRRRKEMTQSVFHFKLYNSLLRELCHSATINNRYQCAFQNSTFANFEKNTKRKEKYKGIYTLRTEFQPIPRRNLLHWQQPRCTISLYHPPRIISIRVIMTRKEMEEEGRRGGSERNKRSNRACGIISAGRFRAVEAGLSPYR